jgi:hypothetical protein
MLARSQKLRVAGFAIPYLGKCISRKVGLNPEIQSSLCVSAALREKSNDHRGLYASGGNSSGSESSEPVGNPAFA